MADVSEARQRLRDYAREEAKVVVDTTFGPVDRVVGVRGELAGLTFEALQGVLEVCNDIRTGKRVLSPLGLINLIETAIEKPFKR